MADSTLRSSPLARPGQGGHPGIGGRRIKVKTESSSADIILLRLSQASDAGSLPGKESRVRNEGREERLVSGVGLIEELSTCVTTLELRYLIISVSPIHRRVASSTVVIISIETSIIYIKFLPLASMAS